MDWTSAPACTSAQYHLVSLMVRFEFLPYIFRSQFTYQPHLTYQPAAHLTYEAIHLSGGPV